MDNPYLCQFDRRQPFSDRRLMHSRRGEDMLEPELKVSWKLLLIVVSYSAAAALIGYVVGLTQ